MRLRALVVDDELHARRGLAALLSKDERIEVIGTCASAPEAAKVIAAEEPDVLFLDIEMPGGTGFDLLETIRPSRPPKLVFVTAFESYALRAFDVRAVDYLLKPFSDERLRATVDRLIEDAGERREVDLSAVISALRDQLPGGRDSLRRFAVRRPGKTEWIPTGEVEFLRSEGDYVELHTFDGKRELVRGPLSDMERRLDPAEFLRTHRSYMVRIDRVRSLRLRAAGTAVIELVSGAEVPVSARRRKAVEDRLEAGPPS